MANQWFKFYGGEYLSDPKIERLNPLERSCWLTLLCLASMSEDGIIEFLTVQTLLNKSGIQFDPYHPEEWESALSILEKLQSLRMIEREEIGTIRVLNWKKRQEHNLTVAERVAKHRKNKANVTSDVTNVTTEENRIEKNRITSETKVSQEYTIEDESEKKPRERKDTSYLQVFELWGKYPMNWKMNRTEIAAAKNILAEHELSHAKKALSFAQTYKDEENCPQILKPSDLDRKWVNLQAFRDKRK